MKQHRSPTTRRGTNGYSIPELIVSLFIFAMLATLVIANFRRGGERDLLRASAQELSGNIRRMQNLATVGQALTSGKVPPGGYGVSFLWQANQNTYTLFADVATGIPGSCVDSIPNNATSLYDVGCDVKVDAGDTVFRPNVVMTSVEKNGVPVTTPSQMNIAFKPPKPVPVIDGVTGDTLKIVLRNTRTGETRSVIVVGSSGQISERIGS